MGLEVKGRIRSIIAVPLFLIAGIGTGLATATQVIEGNMGSFAANSGAWRTWPAAGSPNIDPYTRGHFLAHGRLPMSTFEAIEFLATSDSEGRSLDASCNYTIAGPMAAARWWRLTARQSERVEDGEDAAILSQTALMEANNQVRVTASAEPQPGNWLRLRDTLPLELSLTLFSPSNSIKGANAAVLLPRIVRESC